MNNKRQKRNLLINPVFQLSVIKYFFGIFIMIGFVNLASVYFFFYKFKEKGIEVGLTPDHEFFTFIGEQEFAMYFLMGGALLIGLITLVFGGFIISHRVAGPLYRLTQHMKGFNQGDHELSKVKFRQGDYFNEIETEFNKLVEKIDQ